MKLGFSRGKRSSVNRRAFLRGAGSLAIGLPFLEGLPARSAWAQSAQPLFSMFICHSCGVVGDDFWPAAGAITADSLSGKAVAPLAEYADRLLIVRGIDFAGSGGGCGHADGLCHALTGADVSGGGNRALAQAASVDTVISEALNPSGVEPLCLYSGLQSGYIDSRLSFTGPGQVRAAEPNPYQVFRDLVGLTPTGGTPAAPAPNPSTPTSMDPETQAVVDELAVRRNSVNDYVRDQLNELQASPNLSQADRDRLELHFELVRGLEATMVDMGMDEPGPDPVNVNLVSCSAETLDAAAFEAFSDGRRHRENGRQEEVSLLQMQLAAYAFACNLNATASLQVGDGTDGTVYDVPNNARGWRFHHISHRIQNDGAVGNDAQAVDAHREIDVLRMETFRDGIAAFAAYTTPNGSLLDNAMVLWTNHVADGPSHSQRNVPHIIVGNAGGYFKQGEIVQLGGGGGGGGGGVPNPRILSTFREAVGVDPGGETLSELKA
jgi:hypothetical protein